MAPAKKTLYDILGVPRDANALDIGLAYDRRRAELESASPQDPSALSLLHEAHEVLANPNRRAAYDASLTTQAERAAAAQQAEPDLPLDEEGDKPRASRKALVIAVAAIALLALLLVMMRRGPEKPPAPPPVAEAPKPVPPPPPKPKSEPEIMAEAVTSGGRLLSYEMSGRTTPIGVALSVEPGTMVTTCHGIPAGTKLVVKVGGESYPADLAITDETLDLCRLTVANFGTRPLAMAPDEAKAGDRIYAFGFNPTTGEPVLTEGTVKGLRESPHGRVIEVSMPISPSASGGGIFDPQGRLVGIAITPHAFGAGLHIALPVSWVGQMRSRGRAQ